MFSPLHQSPRKIIKKPRKKSAKSATHMSNRLRVILDDDSDVAENVNVNQGAEEEDSYDVQSILGVEIYRKRIHYHVLWDDGSRTREPLKNLIPGSQESVVDFHLSRPDALRPANFNELAEQVSLQNGDIPVDDRDGQAESSPSMATMQVDPQSQLQTKLDELQIISSAPSQDVDLVNRPRESSKAPTDENRLFNERKYYLSTPFDPAHMFSPGKSTAQEPSPPMSSDSDTPSRKRTRRSDLKGRVRRFHSDNLERTEARLNQITVEKDSLTARVATLEAENERLRVSNSTSVLQRIAPRYQAMPLPEASDNPRPNLADGFAKVSREVFGLVEDKRELKEQVKALEREIETLHRSHSNPQPTTQQPQLEQECERLRRLNSTLTQQSEQVAALVADKERCKNRATALERQVRELQSSSNKEQVQQLQQELKRLGTLNYDLVRQKEQMQNEQEVTKAQVAMLQLELEGLRKSQPDPNHRLRAEELEQLRMENTDLSRKQAELQGLVERLQANASLLAGTVEEKRRLKVENERLKDRIASLSRDTV